MTGHRVGGGAPALLWIALSCGCAARPAVDRIPDALCTPLPGGAAGEIVVAVTERILASRAPVPTNDAETLIFPHLYETLAEVGCGGVPEPALALSFASDAANRVWRIELRGDRLFSDGGRLNAERVSEGWRWQSRRRPDATPFRWIDPDSISVEGELSLRIALPSPCPHMPLLLCHPALSVLRPPLEPRGAPIGTGCARPLPDSWRPAELLLEPNAHSWNPPWSALRVLVRPNEDARELLAEGADLVVSRDREVIDDLRERGSHSVLSMPEDRTYAWLAGPRGGEPARGEWIDDSVRAEMAELVVRAPAVPAAESIGRPEGGEVCFAGVDPLAGIPEWAAERPRRGGRMAPHSGPGIAFNWRDATARELAERLAALASRHDPERSWAAIGLPPAEFRRSLKTGDAEAFIVALKSGGVGALSPIEPIEGRIAWAQEGTTLVGLVRCGAAAVAAPELRGLRLVHGGGLRLDRIGRGEGR